MGYIFLNIGSIMVAFVNHIIRDLILAFFLKLPVRNKSEPSWALVRVANSALSDLVDRQPTCVVKLSAKRKEVAKGRWQSGPSQWTSESYTIFGH